MDEWVKALPSKPDSPDLSLIPGTSLTEGKEQPKLSFDLHHESMKRKQNGKKKKKTMIVFTSKE